MTVLRESWGERGARRVRRTVKCGLVSTGLWAGLWARNLLVGLDVKSTLGANASTPRWETWKQQSARLLVRGGRSSEARDREPSGLGNVFGVLQELLQATIRHGMLGELGDDLEGDSANVRAE